MSRKVSYLHTYRKEQKFKGHTVAWYVSIVPGSGNGPHVFVVIDELIQQQSIQGIRHNFVEMG